MIRRPASSTISGGPELTPMIDIVFIVVVFLLLTANVQVLSLPIDIPDTDSELQKAIPKKETVSVAVQSNPPHWIMSVSDSGTYHYEDWSDFKDSLITQLEEKDISLLITPESDASAEKLLQLLALLNEQAFSDVQILMEPEN